MMNQSGRCLYVLFVVSLLMAISSPAFAGGLYAYPLKGQSAQQQAADRQSCHDWAIAQSGFNPSTIPQEPHGATGAFKGMLVGLLAGGVVAATGGGGAAVAIGAGGGGLIGGIFGKGKKAKVGSEYDAYLRAAQTCMTAKGYQVSI